MKKSTKIIFRIAQFTAAIILLQTLYFKFSAAPESVYIFSTLGLEPYGRIGIGIAELIASLLLLYTPISWLGALLGMGLMAGAIFSHLTQLGISVQGDGGYLFFLAVVVLICCATVAFIQRNKIQVVACKISGNVADI